MPGAAIYGKLSAYAGLTALVSTRIYPVPAPQEADNPHVVYEVNDRPPVSAMGSDTGLITSTALVHCVSTTYDSARAVAKQVKAALVRWSGTAGSIVVDSTFLRADRDNYDASTKLHRTTLLIDINYQE